MQILAVSSSTFHHCVLTYLALCCHGVRTVYLPQWTGTLEVRYSYPFTPYKGVLSEGMNAAEDKK